MDNKVGDILPSHNTVTTMKRDIAQVLVELRKFGIVLDADERRRLLHARRGSDVHVQRVHDLSVRYGIALPGIPLDGLQNDVSLVSTLHPIVDELRTALALAEDTAAEAESEMWEAFLAYYATLSGMAPRLPELATELDAVSQFMSEPARRRAATLAASKAKAAAMTAAPPPAMAPMTELPHAASTTTESLPSTAVAKSV